MTHTINDILLADQHNTPIHLPRLWAERPVLLFLMRHLGCGLCRQQLLALRDCAPQFTAAGVDIAVIAMGDGPIAKSLRELYNLPFAVYGDPRLAVYDFFEFGEGSLWQVAGPHIIARQFHAYFNGVPSDLGHGSIRRLGGLVALDTDGNVLLHYVANPIYRYPKWEDVLKMFQSAAELRRGTAAAA